MQRALEEVHVSEQRRPLHRRPRRRDAHAASGSRSARVPRGSLALLKLSRCRAALQGRDFVTPDDVKAVAVPALAHRLTLRPELWVQRISARGHRPRDARAGADAVGRGSAPRPRVNRTPKLGAYAGLTALGLLRRARPRAAGARGARGALRAHARARACAARGRRTSGVELELDRERVLEGDEITLALELEARVRRRGSSCSSSCRDGLELVAGAEPARAAPRGRRGADASTLRLRCARWGAYSLRRGASARPRRGRPPDLGADDRSDPRRCGSIRGRRQLRELVRAAADAGRSRATASRATKGEGLEFADLRPFAPATGSARINWRASARRGELWVNEQHAERNADVIIFLDSFAEAQGRGRRDARPGDSGRRLADRALPRAEGPRRPRQLRRCPQLAPAGDRAWCSSTGSSRRCLNTEITLSYAWKDIDVLPRRTLPPKALVLALTPLLDERAVRRPARPAGARFRPRRSSRSRRCRSSPAAAGGPASSPTGSGSSGVRRGGSSTSAPGRRSSSGHEGDPLTAVLEGVSASRRHARIRV